MHAIPRGMVCVLGEVAAARRCQATAPPVSLAGSHMCTSARRPLRLSPAAEPFWKLAHGRALTAPGRRRNCIPRLAPLLRPGAHGRIYTGQRAVEDGAPQAIGACRTRTRRHQGCTRRNGNAAAASHGEGLHARSNAEAVVVAMRCVLQNVREGRLLCAPPAPAALARPPPPDALRACRRKRKLPRSAPPHRVLWRPCTAFRRQLHAARTFAGATQPVLRHHKLHPSDKTQHSACAQTGLAPQQAPACPGADVDHRCKSAHFVYPNRSRSQRGNRRSADSGEVLEDSCRV